MTRRAFTLIELLVVVAVIAIMAAMLMPALEGARERARTTVCLANMRQIALAVGTYAVDFAERFPGDYGCYNVVQPGFDKLGPMKSVWDYNAAASGRWTNAANKNSIGKMGHWCNQLYAYVPNDRVFLCNVLIHVWQDLNTYEEDRYDFAPYGILPDYILYTNNAREVVPVNFNNVCGYGTNKFSDIPHYGRPSRMSLIEHEHWGEAPPRIPPYMAGAGVRLLQRRVGRRYCALRA